MAKPWAEVEASEAYQALSPEDQIAAKTEYFDTVVTPKEGFQSLSKQDQTAARNEFFGEQASTQQKVPNLGERVFDIPSAAIRSSIQGTGYEYGANNFRSIPKFQDMAIEATNSMVNKIPGISQLPAGPQTAIRFAAGAAPSAAGFAADTLTNPAETLIGLATGTQTGRNLSGISALQNTAAGKAFEGFLTKQRQLPNLGSSVKNAFQAGRATFSDKALLPILDNIEGAVYSKRSQASKVFGEALNKEVLKNPTAVADISSVGSKLRQTLPFQPELAPYVDSVPELKVIVDTPSAGKSLGVKDIQNIINKLQEQVSPSALAGQRVKPSDRPILSLIDELKLEQSAAFPGIDEARSTYRQNLKDFNLLKNKVRGDSLERSLMNRFGGARSRLALERYLADKPEVYRQVKNLQRAYRIKLFGRVATGKITEGTAIGTAVKLFD